MKALISGVGGQDGSYLAELLLSKNYEVHGLVRSSGTMNFDNLEGCLDWMVIHRGDVMDAVCLMNLLEEIQPDEVYNLAAMSQVGFSFSQPIATLHATGLGAVNVLEAVRKMSNPHVRFYQASTSEIFGNQPPPQSERTPFAPRSPYAVAKLCAHYFVKNYREGYHMFASNGILFNHESPRRGEMFVTRKITKAIGEIVRGEREGLSLGNLEARRDWGYAPDYVRAMWLMLQHEKPDDFVIGTGETHTIKEFLDEAFACVNLDWHDYVDTDFDMLRPNEVNVLKADWQKANYQLGWEPSVTFKELVKIMVEADVKTTKLQHSQAL